VNVLPRKKIVLLGMMAKMPVAGVVWQTLHYLVGLQRLGYEVYYVEAHATTPTMFLDSADHDGSEKAATFLDGVLRRFDFGDRWAFHALHTDGRSYGMSPARVAHLYDSARLIINLHGGTLPLPEHCATNRLVFLETDPVQVQIELADDNPSTTEFLDAHCAYFTFGENYGRPGCLLPVSDRYVFFPTRQPVVLDFWRAGGTPPGPMFTTVGNWRQRQRELTFGGERYSWSKHHEFLKFLDLPSRVEQSFELALSKYDESDREMLQGKGWNVRHALDFSTDLDDYRCYIASSRGEFTVAKDQNVRLRSGWFSDRSATYLAAGRPVITQETGFSDLFPTGAGLFAFSDMEEVVEAVTAINADYEAHSRAATDVAREFFDSDLVLSRLLADVGENNGDARTFQ
jgi:hypothetical protein